MTFVLLPSQLPVCLRFVDIHIYSVNSLSNICSRFNKTLRTSVKLIKIIDFDYQIYEGKWSM